MCSMERDGETVDTSKRKERIFLLPQPTKPGYHQCKVDYSPGTRLPIASVQTAPGWWFHDFEPIWRPFIQRFCRQKKLTLLEFEQAASQVPGLTHIEKTIAISAFRQQQEDGLRPSHSTTAFHNERTLSAV